MSNYRSSARNFFKEHNVNKEKARKIVEQKTANDRKILETLDADTEILNLDTWKIGNDISNVLEKVVIKSLSLLK
ncbi:MAG: hypothetical protein LBI53_04635 [Candidatus Peribacteria bacterium]|jgi:hypothetical protein|nr:hypothetical protein [Candidatus Peribacteria bacterium]